MPDFHRFPTTRETLEKVVECTFYRAGGPGGQHRNKTETAVRLVHRESGITVTATERRSQARNRDLAWERLIAALKKKNYRPRKRKATKPTKGSVQRRLSSKKKRADVKKGRSERF
ncbi:MAG: peptide chain release factor-like protein [Planctomycetota bacterium]